MKVEVVYKLKIVESVDSSEYDKEDITLEEILDWEQKNLESLITSPLGIPGRIYGKVEVNVVED